MAKAKRSARGMSIVEILYAIVILAIGLVALLELFLFATQTHTRAADMQFAVDAATRTMEDVRSRPYDLVQDQSLEMTAEGRSPVSIVVTVAPHPSYGDVKVVSLEAQWDDRSKGQLILETLVALEE